MVIKKLRLKNFQSHSNSTIKFDSSAKLFFVTGVDTDTNSSNGAGKSAIKEALLWGLFGRSKVYGKDLIRDHDASQPMSVEIEFENRKKSVQIIRSRTDKKGTLNVLVEGKKHLGKIEEKQRCINDVVGFSYEQFVNYSVIDRVRFMDLDDLSSKELQVLLHNILGRDRIQKTIDLMAAHKLSLKRDQGRYTSFCSPSNKRLEFVVKIKKQLDFAVSQETKNVSNWDREVGKIHTETMCTKVELDKVIRKQKQVISLNVCPVLPEMSCPVIKQAQSKCTILNKLQEEITGLEKAVLGIAQKAQFAKKMCAEAKTKKVGFLNRSQRVSILITKLQNALKMQKVEDNIALEEGLYDRAIKITHKFLAHLLTGIAHTIEKSINPELQKFLDIQCHLNLVKYGNDGSVSPHCSVSVSRNGLTYSYSMLSSGEKAIVALLFKVILCTLYDNSGILILDEGLDSLDQINRDRFLRLLENSVFDQVFIISHREDMSNLRNAKLIKIVKTHGISTVS